MNEHQFRGAFIRAIAQGHGEAWPVVFEPDGADPGSESYEITSVSYEEDLAGAYVIRGHALPGPDAMDSGPPGSLTLAQIQATRHEGAVLAGMEQGMLGKPRRYLLIGYEVYPNGATSDPITDPEQAKEIGRLSGLGDPTDAVGFAIWEVNPENGQ